MYYLRIYLFFYWSSNKLIINGRTGFIIFVVSGKMKYLWRRLLDKLRDLHRSRKKMSRFYSGERSLSNRLIRKRQSLPDINNAHSTVCRWQIIMIPIVLNNYFSFQMSLYSIHFVIITYAYQWLIVETRERLYPVILQYVVDSNEAKPHTDF